MMGDPLTPVDL